MHNIKTIIINTIQKELRRKVFIVTLVVTALLALIIDKVSGLIFKFGDDQSLDMITSIMNQKLSIYYSIIASWNGILAILISVDTVKSDFSFGVINGILSRPISRLQYLLGRILGTWLLLLLYYLLAVLAAIVFFALAPGKLSFNFGILFALLTGSITVLVYGIYGIMASLYIPKIFAAISVFALTIVSSMANSLFYKSLPINIDIDSPTLKALIYSLHFGLPRLDFISKVSKYFIQQQPLNLNIYLETGHFLATTVIIFFALYYLFRRHECQTR